MRLKDQLEEDIKSIFMDEDEFAEQHELDGRSVTLIVDSDRLEKWKEINLPASIALPGYALGDAEVFLFVSQQDYSEPLVGQVILFDGRRLRVVSVAVNNGLMELVLGGSVSGANIY